MSPTRSRLRLLPPGKTEAATPESTNFLHQGLGIYQASTTHFGLTGLTYWLCYRKAHCPIVISPVGEHVSSSRFIGDQLRADFDWGSTLRDWEMLKAPFRSLKCLVQRYARICRYPLPSSGIHCSSALLMYALMISSGGQGGESRWKPTVPYTQQGQKLYNQ